MHSDWRVNLGYAMCSGMLGRGGSRWKAAEREIGESRSWKSLDVGDSVERRVMEPVVTDPLNPENATIDERSKTTIWSRMKSSVNLSFDCCSRGKSKVAYIAHKSECIRSIVRRTHLSSCEEPPYFVPFLPLIERD